ncbi:MAG: hypothetical protein K1X79_10935 [Oligoflexia bacterium]|nr:hypothetical protein [Oligoflexia bacterium]
MNLRYGSLLALVFVCFGACGRLGAPIPPEYLAPESVQELAISGTAQGVHMAWKAPQADIRGRELKHLDGYRIYKSALGASRDLIAAGKSFSLLTTLADGHLADLEIARAELRAQGKPARRARLDASKLNFEYTDTQVQAGGRYLYKVVPFSGNNESASYAMYEVTWDQTNTKLREISRSDLLADDDADA